MKRSKKYKINYYDAAKGFVVACLGGSLFALQQMIDSGTINYKTVLMASLGGGVGYLIKNFFTDTK